MFKEFRANLIKPCCNATTVFCFLTTSHQISPLMMEKVLSWVSSLVSAASFSEDLLLECLLGRAKFITIRLTELFVYHFFPCLHICLLSRGKLNCGLLVKPNHNKLNLDSGTVSKLVKYLHSLVFFTNHQIKGRFVLHGPQLLKDIIALGDWITWTSFSL